MAPVNPNPARITNEMWRLWTDRPMPARLGGFWADKKGYHSSVIYNKRHHPGHYSIRLPLDLVNQNQDKNRAIDLTMTEEEMKKWTRRMKNSAENPNDHRLDAVKEFFGTLDGEEVFGLTKNTAGGPWREASADETHLWHGHMGVFTAFVANWTMLSPILSVWAGDTLQEWNAAKMPLPNKGDSGEEVKMWQFIHNTVRKTVEPDSPPLVVDGDYGDATQEAFADFWKKSGGNGTFDGSVLTGWLAFKYQQALAKVSNPVPEFPSDVQLKVLVNEWLTSHVKENLTIEARISGKVSL